MKKSLLFTMLLAFLIAFSGMSQSCGMVSLIGEFNEWAGDHYMDRSPSMVNDFTTIITVTEADDADLNGTVELKFRENGDWAMNWGSADFPTGTAVADGDNIPVEYGTWYVMFNCETGEYSFTATCGVVSMIGEFNEWAGDYPMMRDPMDPDQWHTIFTVTAAQDADTNGIIEGKFRENADWVVNWGGDVFPADTGYQDGPNIQIPLDTMGITTDYMVSFNCATGWYEFMPVSGVVSMIGEFNDWADDYPMMRHHNNPNMWSTVFTLTADMDGDANGLIETKFRENADWSANWGGDDFPAGVGYQDGPNLQAPLDETGLTTDYLVTFDYMTGEYNFTATCGDMGMIGAFNGWNGDVPMNRDMMDPNVWHLTRSWFADSEVKFRENADWTVNWGDATFPTGVGTDNGPNIPLVAGTYDVMFNCATAEYSFVENADVCGEIGMVGDFNEWGGEDPLAPTDVYLVRDPMYPNLFSLEYNFTSSTELLFRIDGDETFQNVWGGTFPTGGGVFGDPNNTKIQVPGGKYLVTFNCDAGDFHFERLGSAVIAPEVFAISVDGELNETDWDLNQNISRVVMGEPTEDFNDVNFGMAWNDEYLFFGIDVTDAFVTEGDTVVAFVDGDKSGGPYDAADAILIMTGAGTIFIPAVGPVTSMGAWFTTETGYSIEFAIPWEGLGVMPATDGQVGVDLIVGDDDGEKGVSYWLAWNGGLENYLGTSGFGDCVLGTLACGCVSLYNETIGDMVLRNPTDMPTTYVATYEIFEGQLVQFRKDFSSTVAWSSTGFPSGTAELNSSDFVPATPGRYRITFDCISGEYTFDPDDTPEAEIAYADRTEDAVDIDGNLGEYTLNYASNILGAGAGPINNTTVWGALWDSYNLYLGVQVEDAVVEGSGNPWDNDAIEYYFDGNHDQDETYDADFDTQLIQDFLQASASDDTLWIKADGVQFTADQYDAKWLPTAGGYNVELRLAWSIFDFRPGQGRTIGFSLGNNDSDNGTGRDYQSVWVGDGNNWSNTALLGDIQLAGGPYFNVKDIFFNDEMVLFPNPTSGNITIKSLGNVFQGEMTFYVSDISGRTVMVEKDIFSGTNDMIVLHTDRLDAGVYFVNIIAADGKKAMKKLIVQ